jgi:hypothetical protein
MTNEDYHADRTAISSSGLKKVLRSPKDYYDTYILNLPQKPSAALDVGTFFHSLVLEPDTVNDEFAICEQGRRTKAYVAFKETNPGKICLDKWDAQVGFKLEAAARRNKLLMSLLQEGMAEASIFNKISGVNCKVRLDYYTPGSHIVDLKSTKEALSEIKLNELIDSSDYDLSAAMYLEVLNASVPESERIEDYYLGFVSKQSYNVSVVKLSPEVLARGRQKFFAAIEEFKRLQSEGKFDILDEEKLLTI